MLATPVFAQQPVLFDWFEYSGKDAVFETPVPEGNYRNPVSIPIPASRGWAIATIW